MKEIQLTKGRVALVDDADFDWLNSYKWCLLIGGGKREYAHGARKYNGNLILMHRLIFGLPSKSFDIDHIDGNGLNNQRSNLRMCTRSENLRNVAKRAICKAKYKYIHYDRSRQRWQAEITVNGVRYRSKWKSTEEEAAIEANKLITQYHGEFGRLNVIGG